MDLQAFWQYQPEQVLDFLKSGPGGLSDGEAKVRLAAANSRKKQQSPLTRDLLLFLSQFKSPLTLLLVAAVILSMFLGEKSDVFIILFILISTGILSFIQERHAGRAVEKLKSIIRNQVKVMRNNAIVKVFTDEIVPGDILLFSAGDIIPADCLLLECKDIHTNEASLTGESYPAEKKTGEMPVETGMSKRTNVLYQGTSIVSGTGKALAVFTGIDTVFGEISASLSKTVDETAFEAGIRKFGYLLMQITIVLAVVILVGNILVGRPLINSLLFGLALAVGMAPELLPAIMTIAMSRGSKRMAEEKVIVRKLSSIQNLGEVNLLCSDKTGTLTEGVIRVSAMVDMDSKPNALVARLAFLNASFETGFVNPMDEALRGIKDFTVEGYDKTDEIPYDFIRKRLSVFITHGEEHTLITKGAIINILEVCDKVLMADGTESPIAGYLPKINQQYLDYSGKGLRTIGVAYKKYPAPLDLDKEDEVNMIFAGLVLLEDPLKEGIVEVINNLKKIGVSIKVITGDNKLVAAYVAEQLGMEKKTVISGPEISKMSPEALVRQVEISNVFAEIEPQQKENIIKAFRKAGNTVAYIGDGINDVAAIAAADVGISTNNAVDVAKEAADVVLLEKDLDVLNKGIREGRRTFVNTLKYIYTSTSATFGNMFSMAGSSLILPFLPMLPQQILMNNFLSDIPYMTVSSDEVDEEELQNPQRWNLRQLTRFMVIFGLHSSVFDYITFYLLYKLFSSQALFQTGWFIESTCTELLIIFVVRTHKWMIKSRPGKLLIWVSILVMLITLLLPFAPFAPQMGFVVPPWELMGIILGILVAYMLSAELLKFYFFRKYPR